ncbi:MAG: NAD(P)-dependent glycerol-1-phosphate dehydrogenase [Ignisphaera sp.]|uniref:Glycerol-1-phosphate dehydrogenase [NAD(P)+] n=1 Tax=Ignisphaera aggregans TaxID=334771 RepID=A0A7J3N090_9CREN
MHNEHRIDLPKRVIVGTRIIDNIGVIVKEMQLGSHALIVSGTTSTLSYAKIVAESLEDKGIDCWNMYVAKSSKEEVEKTIAMLREVGANTIVGVGGGKALDVAKYTAATTDKYFISVPTSPSHDGIASPFASIRDMGRPTSIKAATPVLVLADVEIISRAPRRNIIAGCCDLLGKFSSVLDWRLAHKLRGEYYGDYAASLALLSAKHILKNSELFEEKTFTLEAIRILVEALISSGIAMAIAGSTRPASGSEHMIAHAIDIVANYPALHGEEVGIGTIISLYLHGRNWKKIRSVLRKIGAPTTAREIGVSLDKIVEALSIAHTIRPERYTILGEKGISKEAAEKIVKVTGIAEE